MVASALYYRLYCLTCEAGDSYVSLSARAYVLLNHLERFRCLLHLAEAQFGDTSLQPGRVCATSSSAFRTGICHLMSRRHETKRGNNSYAGGPRLQ